MHKHTCQPVLRPPHADIHDLLETLAPIFDKLPQLAGIDVIFVPAKSGYDQLANPCFIVDDGTCALGRHRASINDWSVLPARDFDPAALYQLIQTVGSFIRLPVLVNDLIEDLEGGAHPDIVVSITRSCVLLAHADSYSFMMEEGFPREDAIERDGWIAHMLGTLYLDAASSNHARIALAQQVMKDLALLQEAHKGSDELIARRYGVRMEIPSNDQIIAKAIGPREKEPA